MKFCWTTLHVKNLEKSLAFYTEVVGLQVNRRFSPSPNMEIAFLGEGTTELELIQDGQVPERPVVGISMGFIADRTLEEIREVLNNQGYLQQSETYSPNPAIRFFYVEDPDGFKVQFVEANR